MLDSGPVKPSSRSRAEDPTQWGAAEIARAVQRGEVSATEVLEAYLARVEQVNPTLNAVVVLLDDQARAAARAIDTARQRGERLGPLAGVPLTIKECLDVAGTASSLGVPRLARRIAKHDGPLVGRLRAAGAVVVGKTNLPQLAMYLETDGPMFGRTNNPWNLDRSPGGSSGGEAAILAAGGSALGLGTDAGGSIRHPAHCCGIHGLKPTSGRLTQADLPVTTTRAGEVLMPVNLAGLHAILQCGPMARRVADLKLAMDVLADDEANSTDPTVPPLRWPNADRVDVGRLRFGMYVFDGDFPVAPAIERAVEQAADALRNAGAEVEPFEPPDVPRAMRIFRSLLFPDGGQAFKRMLGDARLDPRLKQLMQGATLHNLLRPPTAWLLKMIGQTRAAAGVQSMGKLSADEYRRRIAERAEYCAKFLDAMNRQRLDGLICPPHAVPAPTHGSGAYLGLLAGYTALYNLLGMPAGVVAATRIRKDEQTRRLPGRDQAERVAHEVESGSTGLPVGVQVVARHWREDVVLAAMAVLEAEFERQPDYPQAPVMP